MVCLVVMYAASRYAASTVEGTLSALADWQRSRGVPAGDAVSHHPRVKATLARALRTRSPAHADGSATKAPLLLGLLRLLIGWLAARAGPQPETALRHASDACWQVIGFLWVAAPCGVVRADTGRHFRPLGEGVSVWIARSKAVQLGREVMVSLVECTERGVPIGKIARRFWEVHSRAGGSVADPLFPRWGRTGPAFGHSLVKGAFTARLRELCGRCRRSFAAGAANGAVLGAQPASRRRNRDGGIGRKERAHQAAWQVAVGRSRCVLATVPDHPAERSGVLREGGKTSIPGTGCGGS